MGRPGLTQHRKFKRLARSLDAILPGWGPVLARGSLEMLWDTAYEAGDDYLGDADDLETAAGWRGTPGVLAEALLTAGGADLPGFIEPDPQTHGYRIHDLDDHAPDYVAKRRAREMERRARGTTLRELRAAAGQAGGKAKASKRTPLATETVANGGHLLPKPSNCLANGGTPAPAPAPFTDTDRIVAGEPPPALALELGEPVPAVARRARKPRAPAAADPAPMPVTLADFEAALVRTCRRYERTAGAMAKGTAVALTAAIRSVPDVTIADVEALGRYHSTTKHPPQLDVRWFCQGSNLGVDLAHARRHGKDATVRAPSTSTDERTMQAMYGDDWRDRMGGRP